MMDISRYHFENTTKKTLLFNVFGDTLGICNFSLDLVLLFHISQIK